jgi:hypothetical protein
LKGLDAEIGNNLTYHYRAGEKETESLSVKVEEEGQRVRNGLNWQGTPSLSRPGFIKGHMLMDAGNMVLDPVKNGSIASTYDSMKADGAEVMMYLYYWAYEDYKTGKLYNEKEMNTEPVNETWESPELFQKMASGLKSKGMDLMLVDTVEWVVSPEKRDELSWEEYFEYQNETLWREGIEWDQEMGRRLEADPDDPEAKAYWDSWFESFEAFALYTAEVSTENGTGYIVLGQQLLGAMTPANEQRWRDLIAKVRENYDGKIGQGIWNNEYGDDLESVTWADDLDFLIVNYWNHFSDAEKPSIEELEAKMDEYNQTQFKPLYERTSTPIIIFTPFLSKTYGGKNQWTEPLQANAHEERDFLVQADLYEAFFRSTLDEPWLAGVITFGYWISDDFDPKYSFDKSGSVRNKPAGLVIKKWFDQIEN